jgi:predicted ABC-type ATPase
MARQSPSVVILAGPNGAGKSTAAPILLKGTLGVTEFVNADVIARGISAFEPEKAALTAGRIMLTRLKLLARKRVSFAFETTLASRLFAPWIAGLLKQGFEFHLVFLWLPSADFAVQRVAARVRIGGHDVPEATIRRRYDSGLWNFFELYQTLATTWRMYDNAGGERPKLIARGVGSREDRVWDRGLWRQIKRGIGYEG